MQTIKGPQLIENLQWRYAVKKFDPTKKISAPDWAALEESLILTPSSFGLQPWKFLVVTSPQMRKTLTPLSWNQTQVADCSHYVVFAVSETMTEAYIEKFIKKIAEVRKVDPASLKGYQDVMIGAAVKGPLSQRIPEWSARQAYIALGNFMTSAALMGIDTCPMEGLDPDKYDEALGLKGTGYKTAVACAAGYRSAEDKYQNTAKVRFGRNDLIQEL